MSCEKVFAYAKVNSFGEIGSEKIQVKNGIQKCNSKGNISNYVWTSKNTNWTCQVHPLSWVLLSEHERRFRSFYTPYNYHVVLCKVCQTKWKKGAW